MSLASKKKGVACSCPDCKPQNKRWLDHKALHSHLHARRNAPTTQQTAPVSLPASPAADNDESQAVGATVFAETIADVHAPTTSGDERLWGTRQQDLSGAPDASIDAGNVTDALTKLMQTVSSQPGYVAYMQAGPSASQEDSSEEEPDVDMAAPDPEPVAALASNPKVFSQGANRDKSALDILNAVAEEIETFSARILAAPMNSSERDLLVSQASREVFGWKKSLKSQKRRTEVVQKRKAQVFVNLTNLEALLINMSQMRILPIEHDASSFHEPPRIGRFDVVAQMVMFLGLCLSVLLGTPRRTCNMILGVLRVILETFGLLHAKSLRPSAAKALDDIPKTIETALRRFNLDSTSTVIFGMCPNCNARYAPSLQADGITRKYPHLCSNKINPEDPDPCGHWLVEKDRHGKALLDKPLKPFVYRSFHDYVASLLSLSGVEEAMDETTETLRNAPRLPDDFLRDIQDGEFLKQFEGPNSTKEKKVLFVHGEGEGRYFFSLSVDFFNPERTTSRGRALSCGVISMACLNLPVSIRYKPEYMYLAGLIPGPSEPLEDQLNPYLEPLVEDLKQSWKRGVQYSRTAKHPNGRVTRCALAFVCTDLPATRKLIGFHSSVSHHICSVCDLYSKTNYGNTDWDKWKDRDRAKDFERAKQWRDAKTSAERKKLWKDHGVRWTPLWDLPYFDPCKQVVVDSMHCILEGIVSNHFRYVLRLTTVEAKTKDLLGNSYAYDFTPVDSDNRCSLNDNEITQVAKIHRLLVAGAAKGEPGTTIPQDTVDTHMTKVEKGLKTCNISALLYVIMHDCCPQSFPQVKLDTVPLQAPPGVMKRDLVNVLLDWRRQRPFLTPTSDMKFGTHQVINRIHSVIEELDAPSWVRHVPSNYGAAAAGTLKADEWRTISTIHIPLALISVWDPRSPLPLQSERTVPNEARRLYETLRHTMLLVAATRICCLRWTSKARIERYRINILGYIKDLDTIHKHADHKSNHHMAIHIARFLGLFGPVRSWWTFPFERLIGRLQRVKINHHVGQLEETIVTSYHRGVQVRQWLHRPECPPSLLALKELFDNAFSTRNADDTEPDFEPRKPNNPNKDLVDFLAVQGYPTTYRFYQYYHFDNTTYSPASTHTGNSLIRYYVANNKLVYGSIQYIVTLPSKDALFVVRRLIEAPDDAYDPFAAYADFPAKLMSAHWSTSLEIVKISKAIVIGQYARWRFSNEGSVVLDLQLASHLSVIIRQNSQFIQE